MDTRANFAPILEVRGLTKRFGGLTAVKNLNLDLRDTQRAAIHVYESMGYRRWGSHPFYAFVEDRFVPGHYYFKRLDGRLA